jgi:hypothetical protein
MCSPTSRYPLFRATANFYGNSVTHSPDLISEDSIISSTSWCLHQINFSRPRHLHLHLSSPNSTMNRDQGRPLSLDLFHHDRLHPGHRAKNCASLHVPMDISAPGTAEPLSIDPYRTQPCPLVRTQRSACQIFISLRCSFSA